MAKKYLKDDINGVFNSWVNGTYSIKDITEVYNVQERTVRDYIVQITRRLLIYHAGTKFVVLFEGEAHMYLHKSKYTELEGFDGRYVTLPGNHNLGIGFAFVEQQKENIYKFFKRYNPYNTSTIEKGVLKKSKAKYWSDKMADYEVLDSIPEKYLKKEEPKEIEREEEQEQDTPVQGSDRTFPQELVSENVSHEASLPNGTEDTQVDTLDVKIKAYPREVVNVTETDPAFVLLDKLRKRGRVKSFDYRSDIEGNRWFTVTYY